MNEGWTGGFGLYVHWPFCQAKCPYCDFNSHVWERVDQARWAEAYCAEIARLGSETEGRVLGSVFFGGGTPSLMQGDTVHRIMDAIRATWPIANDWEVTLEANPTSVERERFRAYREAGINRLSLGVQALNDADLRALGRLHSASDAIRAMETARDTFDRVSIDLIYARQHQTAERWEAELHHALSFGLSHLSLYQLTIEPGTAFAVRHDRGNLAGLPCEDEAADMYEATVSACEAAGLSLYEISNFAKTGSESRHNLLYWTGGDYAGIGPGAHGRLTLGGTRWATEATPGPRDWLSSLSSRPPSQENRTPLSDVEQVAEYLMMGLRIVEGVSASRLQTLGVSDRQRQLLETFAADGYLDRSGDRIRTTTRGRIVLNALLRDLIG